jgi:hypothetical protein
MVSSAMAHRACETLLVFNLENWSAKFRKPKFIWQDNDDARLRSRTTRRADRINPGIA